MLVGFLLNLNVEFTKGGLASVLIVDLYQNTNDTIRNTLMNLITTQERVLLLKKLLDDPDDWVSHQILMIADNEEQRSSDMSERSELALPIKHSPKST